MQLIKIFSGNLIKIIYVSKLIEIVIIRLIGICITFKVFY